MLKIYRDGQGRLALVQTTTIVVDKRAWDTLDPSIAEAFHQERLADFRSLELRKIIAREASRLLPQLLSQMSDVTETANLDSILNSSHDGLKSSLKSSLWGGKRCGAGRKKEFKSVAPDLAEIMAQDLVAETPTPEPPAVPLEAPTGIQADAAVTPPQAPPVTSPQETTSVAPPSVPAEVPETPPAPQVHQRHADVFEPNADFKKLWSGYTLGGGLERAANEQ